MAWDTWKGGSFQELKTDHMATEAQSMLKKLTKLAREVKVHIYTRVSSHVLNSGVVKYTNVAFEADTSVAH